VAEPSFDQEDLDPEDPFEVDDGQWIHLYKHEGMDISDVYEVWSDNPLFYPAPTGPAVCLMVGEVTGDILLVPLAKAERPNQARPIGVYKASGQLDRQYRQDSR
jgi:hypothetical protein